jgi:hypothetical protein
MPTAAPFPASGSARVECAIPKNISFSWRNGSSPGVSLPIEWGTKEDLCGLMRTYAVYVKRPLRAVMRIGDE